MVKKHTAALIPSLTLHKIEQIIKGLVTMLLKVGMYPYAAQMSFAHCVVWRSAVWIMKRELKSKLKHGCFFKVY